MRILILIDKLFVLIKKKLMKIKKNRLGLLLKNVMRAKDFQIL